MNCLVLLESIPTATRRVREAINRNNINRDSKIEISEAWIPMIKKHNN